MYAERQNKEKVSRRIVNNHSLKKDIQQIMLKSNMDYSIPIVSKFPSVMQPMKRQRPKREVIDWSIGMNHPQSLHVTYNGDTYNLRFTSGYRIYGALVLEAEKGHFEIAHVHGERKTYTTHLVIKGFRSQDGLNYATWDVYGYDNNITHLQDRVS